MPDEIPENEESKELTTRVFPELVMEEEPELEMDIPTDGHKTLSETESQGINQSDLVSIIRRLLPSFSDSEIEELDMVARSIMVSNVSPDMFVEAMRLTCGAVIRAHAMDGITNNKKPVNVMMVINIIFGIYSPALSGKVRVELVELAGSARDQEELEKVSKGLGFGT